MYSVLQAVGWWISRWSPRQAERRARGLAVFFFDVLRFRRRLILRNLEIAFGAELDVAARIRMGRASMQHFWMTMFEFLSAFQNDLIADVEGEGVELVQQALAGGRGAYMLVAHLGNWEALGPYGTRHVAPVHSLVKEVGRGGANRFVDALRRHTGHTPIYRSPPGEALKAVRRVMKANQLVGFMLDQARPGAPRIPFFGTPAKTQTSLAAIWRKYPAPVIPASIHRLGYGRHRVKVWPELAMQRTDDARRDTEANTALLNRMLETMIRETPEQYFWLHDRWKA